MPNCTDLSSHYPIQTSLSVYLCNLELLSEAAISTQVKLCDVRDFTLSFKKSIRIVREKNLQCTHEVLMLFKFLKMNYSFCS